MAVAKATRAVARMVAESRPLESWSRRERRTCRPFILSEGLPLVPHKLVSQIWRGEYVDMAELLRDNLGSSGSRAGVRSLCGRLGEGAIPTAFGHSHANPLHPIHTRHIAEPPSCRENLAPYGHHTLCAAARRCQDSWLTLGCAKEFRAPPSCDRPQAPRWPKTEPSSSH